MGFDFDARYAFISQLSNEDAAYLAGMIDADGTITASHRPTPNADGTVRMPMPLVLVVNTHLGLIEWLKQTIGYGCAYETKTKPTRPDQNQANWNKVHRFQITGRAARALVIRVRPFLRVKAERADLMLKLPCRGIDYLSSASVAQRDAAAAILDGLRALNKRG